MKKTLILLLISSVSLLMATSYEIFSEGFEGSFPPTGWTLNTITGHGFTQHTNRPHTGTYSMVHFYSESDQQDGWMITPLLTIPTADSVKVSFWSNTAFANYADVHQLCVSTNMVDWDTLYADISSESAYEEIILSLDAYIGQDIYIGWHYAAINGDDWYIDDVLVTGFGDFTEVENSFPVLGEATFSWGDYDNDGDLDLLLTGESGSGMGNYVSNIYRNDSGTFTDINAGLIGVRDGSVAWGDYDNDGYLDIALSGLQSSESISRIYHNNGDDTFTDIDADILDMAASLVSWADYDNDGGLDLLLTGMNSGNRLSKLYRNDSGIFTDTNSGIVGVQDGAADWGDYDNDGDLDLLITGWTGSSNLSYIYRNDSGTFTNINAGLTGVRDGSVAWGDYDSDGDLDILLTGYATSSQVSSIYHNNGDGTFIDIGAGLLGVGYSSAGWGDYDNDGDLDIFLMGYYYSGSDEITTKIYRNDSGIFVELNAGLESVSNGCGGWVDYDNDSDLDLLLTGYNGSESSIKLYRNNSGVANVLPDIVHNFYESDNGYYVNLSWDPTIDYETSEDGLSYNLYIGTSSKIGDIVSPMSDIESGYRKVVSIGNMGQNTSYTIHDLPSGTYYWSVQAVDNGFAGSAFGTEQSFTFTHSFDDIEAGLIGVSDNSAVWGDYDNDGDLDIIVTGDTGTESSSRIYRNDFGVFTDINAGLPGVDLCSVAWGDYDNDGDLDILLTGVTSTESFSRIYRNDFGTFTDINAGLEGVVWSSVAWGDYDNDGDLDILLSGYSSYERISKIYRNDSGIFTDINAGLTGVDNGSVSWGDYDNDGDLDILLTGTSSSGNISKIYRNDSGVFADIMAGLTGVGNGCSEAWGDYDNDGDLDIIIAGYTGSKSGITSIYRNDSGIFTDINAGLLAVQRCSVDWGDYDNDGDLDILISGLNDSSDRISRIYSNNSGNFTELDLGLEGIYLCTTAWGDYDNDGDLDILLTGDSSFGKISKIYRNNSAVANSIPSKPSRLLTQLENDVLELTFNPATDNESPQSSLSYNVELIINDEPLNLAMSNISNGYKKVVDIGNAGQNKFYKINNFLTELPQTEREIIWKVQAVDQAYAGSEFATSFNYAFHSARDLALLSKSEMTEDDKLEWEFAYPDEIDHYVIQVADNSEFTNTLEEVLSFDKSTVIKTKGDEKLFYINISLNSLTQFDSLVNNTTYYWRVKPVYLGINRFTIFSETPASFVYHPTTGGALPTAPISGFSPANDDVADSLPMISWGNATDPDGHAEDLRYTIELDSVNTFGSVIFTDTTKAGETFTQVNPALAGGYRYYYRIKTIDADSGESVWSATQQFITLMPPQAVKITDDGTNVNLTWDEMPLNTKGVVYTVYSSEDPDAEFPVGWNAVGLQLTTNSWSEPHGDSKKFYRVTVGSSGK